MLRVLCIWFLCTIATNAQSQFSSLRSKTLVHTGDTIQLDSMALWPESLVVVHGFDTLPTSAFYFNAMRAELYLPFVQINDSIYVSYNILPWKAGMQYRNKELSLITSKSASSFKPFVLGADNEISFLQDKGIQKNGSISRGILFGNNQNLSVSSTLNLQLSGKVSDKITLLASITDDNIPIQPSGNTQQLQDFDQVFIQLSDDKTKVIAGDFQLRRPAGYFLNYFKRAQGLYALSDQKLANGKSLTVEASASVSKGRFARNVIQGIEGNQGPYRLRGADNELFIIVLSGTELVYIDGRLLERGMDKDYVIDYNSAEISFTPRHLITKDRRITVEFQYSERRYARPLLHTSVVLKKSKSTFFMNLFSESDARNQPLQQDLSSEDKAILAAGGDDFLATFRTGYDSLGYSNTEVRYALVDSLEFDSVFVFSEDSAVAFYRVNFSYVGLGNGDYIENGFSANGRTYRWVAPVYNGAQWVKQGAYAPLILLAAPKKNNFVSAGFSIPVGKASQGLWSCEGALSQFDRNTFSNLDASDDLGGAFRTRIQLNELNTTAELDAWNADSTKFRRTSASANYEFTHRHFNPIERFREVEFSRNWNISNLNNLRSENHLATIQFSHRDKRWGLVSLAADVFHMPLIFDGYKIKGTTDILTKRRFLSQSEGSLLLSSGLVNSFFARHKGRTAKDIGKLRFSIVDEYERNLFYAADTIQNSSYEFLDWEASIGNADTTQKSVRVFYRDRIERKPLNNLLSPAARADHYGMQWVQRWKNDSRISVQVSNRRLRAINPELFTLDPENTLLARGEFSTKLWKNAIQNTTFYEIGSGLEQRREFIYLEVPAGQGVYVWNDYDGDNVKDLNEFEVAVFAYEANYIRSFVQSNEYVKTYSNQFSESVIFQPARLLKAAKPTGRFLAKLSSSTTFRVERKTTQENGPERFSPLLTDLPDSILLASQGVVRNILYFNKANPVFGMDYTSQFLENRNLLSNGFESRNEKLNQITMRWNFWKALTLFQELKWGDRAAKSDFLNGRNFLIRYNQLQPKLTYQPSPFLKVSALAQYADKRNSQGLEQAIVRKLGAECTWNVADKGSVRSELNFYEIDFSGTPSSSLGFEMLEGLVPGSNYTWLVSWQRNVSEHIQLNIQYNGRMPQDVKPIHAGSVQVRAVF
jgi:hypothetical protein